MANSQSSFPDLFAIPYSPFAYPLEQQLRKYRMRILVVGAGAIGGYFGAGCFRQEMT